MVRDPRYDVLFEPVQIGPLTAKNRFYQVPQCTGMGTTYPRTHARHRELKAEGGWAVVSVEETMIHPSSESAPLVNNLLLDDGDIAPMALIAEAIHKHDALAAIELVHHGLISSNRWSREPPLGPSPRSNIRGDPIQARGMSKSDIRECRRWHREAALRARQAGYDIVYVYAAHNYGLAMHFLSRRYNRRTDEYGGSIENRARLLRELIEDAKEAVGDSMAVAVRLAVDELLGPAGITAENEGREVLEMLGELPDLWDLNVATWSNDSMTSRFAEEGYQEKYIAFAKALTSKPVVGVGRFTSPDTMVSQIRRGVLDFIGAARPSIADPFLPRKIEEGRPEDIRECIGCNICISVAVQGTPIRCTQNPTAGEEWRRDWHPEQIAPRGSDTRVLVVGAGPAGLEAARALGARGYQVALAEATAELGGRVTGESHLPGLAAWRRVIDHRLDQLGRMVNVETYRDSRLTAEDILAFGFEHVAIASGARWRADGVGRTNDDPVPGHDRPHVLGAGEVLAGAVITGPVVVFDDDHTYLGGLIAEKLRGDGHDVTLVTPESKASAWMLLTLEQPFIQTRLLEMGVAILPDRNLAAVHDDAVELACVYTGRRETRTAGTVVMVTSRISTDGLYHELAAQPEALEANGIRSLARIGDADVPGLIAAAVWSGHRFARELDAPPTCDVPYLRERIALDG